MISPIAPLDLHRHVNVNFKRVRANFQQKTHESVEMLYSADDALITPAELTESGELRKYVQPQA